MPQNLNLLIRNDIYMKKGKITMTITIGIACFALALVMFMQFKIVTQTDITSIQTMREEELLRKTKEYARKNMKICCFSVHF